MSRSLRRGVLAASLALLLVPLTACAAGQDAPTLQVRPDNAATSVGDIEIQAAVVIVGEGEHPPALVSATLVNNGRDDQILESVALDSSSFQVEPPEGKGGTVTVPAGGILRLGGKGNASATLPDFSTAGNITLGDFAKVTFKLSETGAVSLQANVVPQEGYYKPFGPSPQATQPTAAAQPSEPAAGTKPSPSGTASPGATEQAAGGDEGGSANPGTPESPNATNGPTKSPSAGN